MRKPIFFLLIILTSLFSSCAYEFSEDFYKDIETSIPTATLTLNQFENEITLRAPVNVSYQYNGDNKHRLFEIIIYVDNEQIQYDSDESGTFYIDIDNLDDGEHQLKVEYYFSSGTGSLADVYNLEAYFSTQDYVFFVDKSIGDPPNLTSVQINDGTLYINWDLINHSDFNEAYLIIENENNQQYNQILLSEEDMNSGVYNDNLSLHTELYYSIRLINNYNSSISNKVSISIPELVVEVEILNENQHVMRWEEHPLYGNFDHYKYSNYGYNDEILDSRGGELIFDTDPIFGERLFHYLYLFRDEQTVGSITKIRDFGKPFALELPKELVYSTTRDAYFAIETVGPDYYGAIQQLFLHQLDPNNLSITASVLISNITAPTSVDLTLDPISNNLIIDTETTSYLLDSSDLSIINSWQIADFNFNANRPLPHFRNGYMIIENTVGAGNVSIYNAETKALIYSADMNYYFKISDDGKYFYNQDAIYEINNNIVNFIASTDTGSSVHAVEFLSDQNKCIYSNSNLNPVIFDFNNQSKTIITEITQVNDLRYDQSTGKVLFSQLHSNANGGHRSFANIYNLSTQSFQRLQVYDSHYGHYYRFLNNTLIFSGGLYLDEYLNN